MTTPSDSDSLVKGVMDFTGCTKEKAMDLLEKSGWNVPEAVTRFFNSVDVVEARDTNNSGSRGAPVPSWKQTLLSILSPLQYFVKWIFKSVWSLLKFFFGVPQPGHMRNGTGSLREYFRALDVGTKPTCVEGDFAQALTMSRVRDNRRVLIIFLGNPDLGDFQNSTKNVLCDESVVSVIDGQFLFWAGDTNYRNVDHIRRSLPVRAAPVFAAVVSVNASELKIAGICGGVSFTVDNVLTILQKAQEAQDHLMAEDEQFKIDRSLREEQDKEYEEALERDRKIEEEKQIQQDKVVRKLTRREANDARKTQLVETVFKEAIACAGTNTCTILVRLPNGVRIDRIFDQNDKIDILYDWVHCSGLLFPAAAEFGRKIFSDNFVLSTSFPTVRIDDKSKTFTEYGLVPNAVLSFSFTNEDDLSDLDQ